MTDPTIKLTPRTKEFLRVICARARLTEESVLERYINEKMFLLDDLRDSLIAGYILEGRSKHWIVNHLPGNIRTLELAYEEVRKEWSLHSEEPLPEGLKESKEK